MVGYELDRCATHEPFAHYTPLSSVRRAHHHFRQRNSRSRSLTSGSGSGRNLSSVPCGQAQPCKHGMGHIRLREAEVRAGNVETQRAPRQERTGLEGDAHQLCRCGPHTTKAARAPAIASALPDGPFISCARRTHGISMAVGICSTLRVATQAEDTRLEWSPLCISSSLLSVHCLT